MPTPTRPGQTLARGAGLLAALLLAAPGSGAVVTRGGPLGLHDCRLQHPAGLGSVPARCGTLQIAENPAEAAGRQLSLAVAVVPALDRPHALEPLFIVAGGPGQAASDFYAGDADAFARAQRPHDRVLVDQRGTGRSNRLGCDLPPDLQTKAPSAARLRELAAACRGRLAGRPQYYTTSVAIGDLEAVRAALGAASISLYGVSYGTRVVEHYVRRYPGHARAVVLDGALDPTLSPEPQLADNAARALALVFARCGTEHACAQAFPDPAGQFAALQRTLTGHPQRLRLPDPTSGAATELELDAAALAATVRIASYATTSAALLPFLIDRATHGDYAPLAAQLLMSSAHLDAQLAQGMNLAVSCSEDLPRVTPADRARAALTFTGPQQLQQLTALCEGWPAGIVDADLYAPLSSSVPALVLSGELDPVTPPAFGERAAASFAEHLHVVVPGQAHGQLAVGCTPRLIAAFLDAGSVRDLDVQCLRQADPAPFVIDLGGPAP